MTTDPTQWLLDSDEPWTRYRTMVDLLDLSESEPRVQQARSEMLDHPQVQALIDGANTWQVFLQIAVPMARGGMDVVGLFEFLYAWGEYLITLTMIDYPELQTLSVAVSKISGWAALFTSSAFSTYGSEAAAHVVAMLPVIIVFILMQKWFIRGLTEGILKM